MAMQSIIEYIKACIFKVTLAAAYARNNLSPPRVKECGAQYPAAQYFDGGGHDACSGLV